MSGHCLLEELTWPEVKEAIRKNTPLALIVGSVEQHGPHLPLATDTYIPLELAKSVATKTPLLIAPVIAYGAFSRPRSGGGQSFVGTTSISGNVLTELIRNVVGEYLRQGFRRILLLSGHMENTSYVTEGAESAIASVKDAKALLVNWWDIVPEHVLDSVFPQGFPGWETEHASVTETSLIQFFKPELVRNNLIRDDRASRIPKYEIIPAPKDVIPDSGVLWKATLASPDKGRLLAEAITKEMLEIIRTEF